MTKNDQESFYKSVGIQLTSARKRRNMTIADLVKASGEQNKTIRSIESGKPCAFHHFVWMKKVLGLVINIEGSNDKEKINIEDFI